jgi:hypothetical protein
MDDIAVNNISYYQLIRWIQNAWKPTNFAVAVQELARKYESSSPFPCRRYSRPQAIANNHPIVVFR